MSAYWIGRARVRDVAGIRRYGELQARAAAIYTPEVLTRGGDYRVLEGADLFDRHVLLRFQSMERALEYYNSPEYQAAAAVRQAACDACELVLVEGAD